MNKKMKVVYIAGPFRGPNHFVIAQNIRAAEALALEVWQLGAAAICPHANTAHFQDAIPDSVVLAGDIEILRRCDAILMLPKWPDSEGARAELLESLIANIPVFYTVDTLKDWLGSLSTESYEANKFSSGGCCVMMHGDSPGC